MTDNPTRRDALKALAAATGAVTLAALPAKWAKPALRIGAIPAHAQASCVDMIIEFSSGGGGQAFFAGLPQPDEGNPTPAVGESGVWVWYCGLSEACFTLGNSQASGGASMIVTTPGGGTTLPIVHGISGTSTNFYSATLRTFIFGACPG